MQELFQSIFTILFIWAVWKLWRKITGKDKKLKQKREEAERLKIEKTQERDNKISELGLIEFYKSSENLGFMNNDQVTYNTGHPDIIKPGDFKIAFSTADMIIYVELSEKPFFEIAGKIPLKDINNITAEDKSYMEKRTSALETLAYGPAVSKMAASNKKVEQYYVLIEWTEGKFTHNTIFQFTGKHAVSNANEFRSKLINYANKVAQE